MRIALRIREDYQEVNEQIRKDSREVRDGYASSRIEFARIHEDSRPVNDSSPSLIRVGTWLGHPCKLGEWYWIEVPQQPGPWHLGPDDDDEDDNHGVFRDFARAL